MSVESAKAKLDAQPGDPATGYISKADHQDSYTELVDDTALTGATTAEALTISGTLNGRDPDNLVAGPASATDNALVRFDGTGGKTVQNSGITVDDSNNITSDLTVSKTSPVVTFSDSSGSGTAAVLVSSAAGQRASVSLRTGTSNRWIFRKSSDAESGSSAGSNWEVVGVDDSNTQSTRLTINRATGKTTLGSVGATAGLELGSSGPRVMSGTGSPEGVVTAPVGSIWFQTDSTVGVSHWRKATGSGNTGWVVMSGDTGWRDISSSLANGWTGTLRIRRVNNQVDIRGGALTYGSANALLTAGPAGFSPGGDSSYQLTTAVRSGTTGNLAPAYLGGEGDVGVYGVAANVYAIGFSYSTNSAWPTSLPGSAA